MDYKDEGVVKSNIIIYTTEDGLSKIETTFEGILSGCQKLRCQNCFRETVPLFQNI